MTESVATIGRSILSRVSEGLPDGIAPIISDGGILAALLLLTMLIGAVLSKVITEIVFEKLKKVFEHGPWLLLFILYIFPILLLLVTGHFITVTIIALIGVASWFAQHRNYLRLNRWRVIASQLLVFLVVIIAEEWYISAQQSVRNEKVQAFFVLPFKGHDLELDNPAMLKELKGIWKIYHSTLRGIFKPVKSTSVSIQPKELSDKRFNTLLHPVEDLLDRLSEEELSPDLILDNTANIISDGINKQSYLILVTNVINSKGESIEIRKEGVKDDIKYIAIQLALNLLEYIKKDQKLKLPEDDDKIVRKKILALYKAFLKSSTHAVDPAILSKLDSATDPQSDLDIPYQETKILLDAYVRDIDTNRFAKRDKLVRETIGRKLELYK